MQTYIDLYEKSKEKMDEDFNLKNIIRNNKSMANSIEVLKDKMFLDNDKAFDQTIKSDIINEGELGNEKEENEDGDDDAPDTAR